MEVSPVGLSKVERGEEMDIAGEEVRLPQVKKNSVQQPRTKGKILPWQDDKACPSNLTEGVLSESTYELTM